MGVGVVPDSTGKHKYACMLVTVLVIDYTAMGVDVVWDYTGKHSYRCVSTCLIC